MPKTPTFIETGIQPELVDRPTGLPLRSELVRSMLAKTRRRGTPIRQIFVQVPTTAQRANRGSLLASFRSAAHLDAFLFIHALASAKEPYEAVYPAASWARALGLDENTGSGDQDIKTAKTQWSKNVSKLVSLNLIDRQRAGSKARWVLLDESGDGTDYVRPRSVRDGHWLVLPETYWLDDHYRTLSLPAKVMLLISLSSKPEFTLPLERVKDWYGISRSTAQRGFSELLNVGIITYRQNWRIDPSNPRQWSEERHYRLLGAYAADAIRDAMRTRRASPGTQADDDTASSNELPIASPRRKKTESAKEVKSR